MYTIKESIVKEEIIKNSKFITIIYNVSDINEVNKILSDVKEEYPSATHYCYAYIIDNNKKCSDDREPAGTAGIPILKVLESNDLTNILCVIVRYFGGIKLGANGLIRAYTKGVSNAIKDTNKVIITSGYNIDITFNYDIVKEIDYLLKDMNILNKSFGEKITYNLNVTKDNLDIFHNKNIEYKIIKEVKIEK